MSTIFEHARVGDRVWGFRGTYHSKSEVTNGVIERISALSGQSIGIEVKFDNNVLLWYDARGMDIGRVSPRSGEMERELFWSRPEIIAPEQPKQKVTRSVKGILMYSVTGGGTEFRSHEAMPHGMYYRDGVFTCEVEE